MGKLSTVIALSEIDFTGIAMGDTSMLSSATEGDILFETYGDQQGNDG